jgi:succinate-semialdehyde dehydrogenase/glutarate-semialdehyde dehydrogenase
MESTNPATGEVIATYDEWTDAELDRTLERAEQVFEKWALSEPSERAALLANAARVLRDGAAEYARLMTREMGKPIVQSEAEVEKCASVCEYYAEHGARFVQAEPVRTEAKKSYVRFDPLGPILAIMPWNFPFWQVFRFAAPALMAGNVGLLKHASNVFGSALAIEQVFQRAGFPEGVFTALILSSARTEELIAHPSVRAVTLTGSDRAGRAVGAAAGRHLKKAVLELGGSDPFIVLSDADLDAAVKAAVSARVINSGQSCIAAKRFIVEANIYDRFESAFIERMRGLTIGDPLERDTEIGPLAREDLLEDLHAQVVKSSERGARLALGGKRLNRPGYFYAPTVLTHVEPAMPAFDEETFGPVAALCRADDVEHAIRLANHSRFGLGAAIFTTDLSRVDALVRRLDTGVVAVNTIVKSDPRLPFGGVKQSGYGRELSHFGLREFVNIKSVWVE